MKQLSCGRDWHSYKTTDITYYNLNLHFSVWLIRGLQMVSFQLHTEKTEFFCLSIFWWNNLFYYNVSNNQLADV